jgi:transposase
MKQQSSATTETQNKGRVVINFSGKVICVGIDVHQKDYQVAKVCNGVTLGNHRMSAGAPGLIKHLQSHYPGAKFKCVYESCAWGFNLQRALTAAGMECVVAHAADVSTTDKERRRKKDAVDALKLARSLEAGEIMPIHVPDETLQKQRSLLRYRANVRGDITRSKNRLKSLLKFSGIDIPQQYAKNNWSNNFLRWAEQQAAKDELLKDSLLLMLEQIKILKRLLLKVEKNLRQLSQQQYKEQTALAMSVPGIGRHTALLFLLEAGDIRRFKGFDALNDFVGLCPDTNSSGDKEQDKGITTRGNRRLRSAMVEAAWQAIRLDPALLESYQQLTKRMKGSQAIPRIARKLLRRLRCVLLRGTPYQKGVIV